MPSHSDRQTTLPGTGPDLAGMAQRIADAPMKPTKDQKPLDFGLFGDEASQLDLVSLANQARKS